MEEPEPKPGDPSAEVVGEERDGKEASDELPVTTKKRDTLVDLRGSLVKLAQTRPDFVLSFENLTVFVPGEGWKACNCLDSPIKHYAQEYMGLSVAEQDPFYALDNISGFVRSGEMCLVLAPNSDHSCTLIRALTDRLSTRDEFHGAGLYNGIPIEQAYVQGYHRLASYVSANDATHTPVLTVKETLMFAAQCTSDGKTSKQQLEARVDNLLSVLGLSHVADTVVGDENLRGISGGQKRRVTVGEMLTDRNCSIMGFEFITDGLASTDSLKLIQFLASVCSVCKIAGIVSLLQPSDEIVEQFDKLLVLTQYGELAYFGPLDRQILRQVFLGQDAGPTDDQGSICDLVLNSLSDPKRSDAVIQRFNSSPTHDEVTSTLAQIRVDAPPARERDLRVYLPKTKYPSPWRYQFKIIAARRLKLISRNAATYTRVVIAIFFGALIGSLFSELNNDIFGSLSRTGYLFLNCFLVLMLSAAIAIPQTFRERITLFKHRSAQFYSGRIAYLAQVLVDMPLAIIEAFLLSSISYFWVGMQKGVDKYFYFVGVLIGLEFAGQAFGRLLCSFSRKQVYANSLSSVFLLLFGTVAGFMPGYQSIPPVFRWLSWVTPASYAFEGLMLNEFGDSNRTISGFVISTSNGTTAIGSLPGSDWLNTFNIPRAQWGSNQSIKIFDVFMLFIFSLIFDGLGCYFVEHTREWTFNQTRRPQERAKSVAFERQKKEDIEEEGKSAVQAGDSFESAPFDWPTSLVARNLSYFVPIKNKAKPMRFSCQAVFGPCLVWCFGKKQNGGSSELMDEVEKTNELQLLTNVGARFQKGRITALMGTSGAGKTTLMDVIAGYKTGGRIAGDILIDGQPKQTNLWKHISGYAEQQDILNPYLSGLETLRFTAACRLPKSVDREKVISDIVRLMQIEEWMDMVIGREAENEGLPKHARKRLTIAVQLVTRPRILFVDEPTTGLGTTAANLVMQAVRRCTDEMGLITLATIHQPSKLIWDTFDDLLLLVKGGKPVYMGELGDDSSVVLDHFSKLSGTTPPPQVNPADFVLSAVNAVSIDEAVEAFQSSEMYKTLNEDIEQDAKQQGDSSVVAKEGERILADAKKGKNRFKEFLLLTRRHLLTQWRNPSYCLMRLMASVGVSLYMGILFISDKTELSGAVFSIGALFFLVFVLVIPMQATVVPLIEDRAVLYRETTSGLYSRLSYGLGQLAADIPFHMLNALLMFVVFYFLVDFQREGDLIGYFILMLFLANWTVMSLGQLFAYLLPNEESANGLAGLSVILSVIFMGFLILVSAMPSGWVWAYWTNLFHYIIQGFATNELVGRTYNLNLFGNVSFNRTNTSNVLFFGPETDLSPGSVAQQSSAFVGLGLATGGGINDAVDSPAGIAALSELLQCMNENMCLVDNVVEGFISCCIVAFPTPFGNTTPCRDEFDEVAKTVDVKDILKCFTSYLTATNSTVPGNNSTNGARGVPLSFTSDVYENMTAFEKAELAVCLNRALLPSEPVQVRGVFDDLFNIFSDLFGIVMFILDVIENGITIPGELILWVFGWAEFQGDELVAPWKWYYCVTSVVVFLAGIETIKMLAVSFVVWTKR